MEQGEQFFYEMYKLAEEKPDECLSKITAVFENDKSAKSNPMIRAIKGIAYITKAINEFNKSGEKWSETGLDNLENSLVEMRLAGYPDGESANLAKGTMGTKIDAAATILEELRPGRVQETLGKTKLKYFKDRVSIYTAGAEFLIPSDEAMEIFGDVFFNVPYIARYAFVLYMQKDSRQKHYINVSLFEEPKMENAFGEVNNIKGQINLYEDGTFDLGDKKDAAPKVEPKKKGFFKKVFG